MAHFSSFYFSVSDLCNFSLTAGFHVWFEMCVLSISLCPLLSTSSSALISLAQALPQHSGHAPTSAWAARHPTFRLTA